MAQLQRFLVPTVIVALGLAYLLFAQQLVDNHRLDIHHFSLLFESDPSRVIENSTSLTGDQARTRTHPLHILAIAPLGLLLAKLVGSSVWAAVLITVAAALGVLVNVNHVLQRQFRLPLSDRVLFLLLLGASASHVTFAAIPETHVLSAFALSMMVRSLDRQRLIRLRRHENSAWNWLREGGATCVVWASLAVGMLVTSAALLPWFGFRLLSSKRSVLQRVRIALLGSAAVLVTVASLHVFQRAVWPPVRGAVPTSIPSFLIQKQESRSETIEHWRTEESSGLRGKLDYVLHSLRANTTWMTPPSELPTRLPHVLNTGFVNSFYAPRFEPKQAAWSSIPAVTFEPWSSQHRPAGLIGALTWLSLIALLVALGRARLRRHCRRPGSALAGLVALFYLVVFTLYGDEVFLFSPNWAFALVLFVAALYADPKVRRTRMRLRFRSGLALAVACVVANTAMHVASLLAVYA